MAVATVPEPSPLAWRLRTPAPRRGGFTSRIGLVVVLLAVLTLTGSAGAQERGDTVTVLTLDEAAALLRVESTSLEALAERGGIPGRRIGESWRFDRDALLRWLRADPQAGGEVAKVSAPTPLTRQQLNDVRGQGMSGPQLPVDPGPPSAPEQADAADPIGEAPEGRTAEDVFLRGNRLLLGPGDVVLDLGQFYSRQDSMLLAPLGPGVGLASLQQSAFTSVVFGRVGILRETEVFAGTAFARQDTQQLSAGTLLTRSATTGLGATTVGVRHTLMREAARRPDLVASVSGQIPTRNVLPGVSGGLVLVKSIDPVVLFASGNYAHRFERTGMTRPADTVDIALGYGLGLNDSTAISMAVGGLFAGSTPSDAGVIRSPSSFSVRFSVTTALSRGLFLEPSVSVGLSGPGQSFGFGITMPYAF